MRGPHLPYDHGRPIATLALAPLAGVLLTVALVFLALRPPVTHAIVVDLPAPYPDDWMVDLSPNVNRLIVTESGEILWNSSEISHAELRHIVISGFSRPAVALQFDPVENAPFEVVLPVLETLREVGALESCFRFLRLNRYRNYEAAPVDLDPEPAASYECMDPAFL
ncbi:ExbD/TolR family protein [Altererythrobacter sp. CAU 1778]